MAQFLARMVMPRSFSMAFESMMRSPIFSWAAKVPDCFSRQSTSVVLPWSTWAMMAMLRIGRDMGGWTWGKRAARLPVSPLFSQARLRPDERFPSRIHRRIQQARMNRPAPPNPQASLALRDLPREFIEAFRYGRKALELVWQTSRKLTVWLALLTLVVGTLPALVAFIGARI